MTSVFSLKVGTFVELCAAEGVVRSVVEGAVRSSLAALRGVGEPELQRRWYRSLALGVPDYAVYGDAAYLGELWACWVSYSRKYLRSVQKLGSLVPGKSVAEHIGETCRTRRVVDLGCGFGYTCAALREVFPFTDVVGTNIDGTVQMRLAHRVAAERGFALAPDLASIGSPVDLVFASEYFEHHQAPVAHLREVLAALRPRALLVANTFSAPSIGHFPVYDVDGLRVDGAATSRLFGRALHAAGYGKVETRLWNSRPAYWRLR